MSPRQHVAVSAGAGLVLGLLMRSWWSGVGCFLIGVFVDLDHVLDFWMNRGLSLNVREFFEFCYRGTSPTFVDLLHGYEYIPLLVWLATVPGYGEVGAGLVTGYTIHLLGDQFFNSHLHRLTYFLTYRLAHRFDSSMIVLGSPSFLPAGAGNRRGDREA